jgi:hypothetical protein
VLATWVHVRHSQQKGAASKLQMLCTLLEQLHSDAAQCLPDRKVLWDCCCISYCRRCC